MGAIDRIGHIWRREIPKRDCEVQLTLHLVKGAASDPYKCQESGVGSSATSLGNIGGNRTRGSSELARKFIPFRGWQRRGDAVDHPCQLYRVAPRIEVPEVAHVLNVVRRVSR